MGQKTIWLLLLAIGILNSSILQSCRQELIVEKVIIRTYKYVNNTGHSITIKKWQLNDFMIAYDLPSSNEIKFKVEFPFGDCSIDDGKRVTSFNANSNCLLIISDSLKIIFDDSKSYSLKPDNNIKINILKEENYEHAKEGNIEDFSYYFTSKDYENAK